MPGFVGWWDFCSESKKGIMMETKDLRKGNWLVLKQVGKNGVIRERFVQVDQVNGEKINDVEHTHYSPKPITIDVLRQIGFSNEKNANELEMTFLKFTVGDIPHYKLKARKELGNEGYALSLFLGDNQLWPWVNTVHDLQNYFFVQNGQELDLLFES